MGGALAVQPPNVMTNATIESATMRIVRPPDALWAPFMGTCKTLASSLPDAVPGGMATVGVYAAGSRKKSRPNA